jgi:hypothetical protein
MSTSKTEALTKYWHYHLLIIDMKDTGSNMQLCSCTPLLIVTEINLFCLLHSSVDDVCLCFTHEGLSKISQTCH